MERVGLPFDSPPTAMVDMDTGMTINAPLGPQWYPGWQHDHPEILQRLVDMRAELDIVIDDDMWEDKPVPKDNPRTARSA